MLHLHSSCISDIENIEYILKKKDYNGIKTNREIKKIFKDLSDAYKVFSRSLKKIHSNGSQLISSLKKKTDEENSEQDYFVNCFLNIIFVIKNIYEENLAIGEDIEKHIANEFEKEERERVNEINLIYKEEIDSKNNEEFIKDEIYTSKEEKQNDISLEGISLRDIEIDLKECLQNENFANKYIYHKKYKTYFIELNKLNLRLDKEICSFNQLKEKFGKNASKLLIQKSQERISAIQNEKKSILGFLYNDIDELIKNKNNLRNKNFETEYLENNKNKKKEPKYDEHKEKHQEKQEEPDKDKNIQDTQNSFFSSLYLEKFEVREKYRIEKIYSCFRIFLKIIAIRNININKILYKSVSEVSSYDSLIDYQKWLSFILKKDLDITNLQKKIKKNSILTKEEEFLLMPFSSDNNFFNNNSVNLLEKKKKDSNTHFRKGELIFDKQNYNYNNDKNKEEKEIDIHRDNQFPDEFYIPIIIKKQNIMNQNHSNLKNSNISDNKEMKVRESYNCDIYKNLDMSIYLNNTNMNKEKNIITFLTNRQKNYEKYLLQFNNLNISLYQNEKRNNKKKWLDKNFFQGYFYEEGHIFYPYQIPTGMSHLSFFQKFHSYSLNSIDFGDKDINEYDYKLMAYEAILLVYYSLYIQLNCYFLFDKFNKRKINKPIYKKFYEKIFRTSTILMHNFDKYYLHNNNNNNIKEQKNVRSVEENVQIKQTCDMNYQQKQKEEKYSEVKNPLNDYFEYMDYIYNAKLQNLLLVKRIISIFRIKLNLDSKTNDIITLLTIPSHYTNYGCKYSFSILDVRFRIIRILESINFNHIFDFDSETNKYDKMKYNNEYNIYINWVKRQLHLLYISLYLKFSRFLKFIPYFNFSFYPYIINNIDIFENNEEYFSYINKIKEDNSFLKYIKNIQSKIKLIYDFILINKGSKKNQINNNIDEVDKKKRGAVHFISFNSLEKDEKIIFICNLLLKNLIKSFRFIDKLQCIVKNNKWNKGKYNEKIYLCNLIKYFTKIECYDYNIRSLMSNNGHKKKNQEIYKKNKNDINENKNKLKNHMDDANFYSDHISEDKNKKQYFDNNINIDHDELFKNIFLKEFQWKGNNNIVYNDEKLNKNNDNTLLEKDINRTNIGELANKEDKNMPNFAIKNKNKNKFNLIMKQNNNSSDENITINDCLTKKEKVFRNKIFYKLNVETILSSIWYIDRVLLHFFLYFYLSCTIDHASKYNMFIDTPYIMQGIILIIYYLQSGNDLTLKTEEKYNNGGESILIPISTFVLYFTIHLFYSFFDKNLLMIQNNKEQDNLQMFLKNKRNTGNDNDNDNDETKKELYLSTKNNYTNPNIQMITVQNASKFYFIVKQFEDFLSYKTVDEKALERIKKVDIKNIENYWNISDCEEMKEKECSPKKYPQQQEKKKHKKKKKILLCASAPKNSNIIDKSTSFDEEFKEKIEKKKIMKKQQNNDIIYLKRYYNILLFFNYNHLENLIKPYTPNILSYYLNKNFYSNDYFLFHCVYSSSEKKEIQNINDKLSMQYKNKYDHHDLTNKPNQHDEHIDGIYNNNYNLSYDCINNKDNILNDKEELFNNYNKKYRNISTEGSNNLIIKYSTNKKHSDFSLINLSRIEKIVVDMILMRIISCDFRNYFFLILCNYRKFIDMYSLPYILDIFITIHKFFTINNNAHENSKKLQNFNENDENKFDESKNKSKGEAQENHNAHLQCQHKDNTKDEKKEKKKQKQKQFDYNYNIYIEDDEDNYDNKESPHKKEEKKGINNDDSHNVNILNKNEKNKRNLYNDAKYLNKKFPNEEENLYSYNLKKNSECNSSNKDSSIYNNNFIIDSIFSDSHKLSNYLKFFIYSSTKNIFYNILCNIKEDIILNRNANYDNIIEQNDQRKQEYQENNSNAKTTVNENNVINNKEYNIDNNTIFKSTANNEENNKYNDIKKKKIHFSQNCNEIIISQYIDIIKKYINEIVIEILFFSNIWKHYLPLEEHPLIVLYAANKTLYYEIVKLIKISKDKSSFNQSLSIITSLYNFNLLNKEIILQTNTHLKYQTYTNENYEASYKRGNTLPNDGNNDEINYNKINKNNKKEIKNRVQFYYESKSSFKKSSIDKNSDKDSNLLKYENDEKDKEKVVSKNSDKDDMFINLSLIISNVNNPYTVELMFMLEKMFIKVIDDKLEDKKNLLTKCLKNEKLVPLNFPDIIYNSTSVDIFSIISHILEALFEYKTPVEWIITPFLEFLSNFINKYCENYKKSYSSFIISVLNQYADKYFNDLLNLKEQKIQWDKYSNVKKKKKKSKKNDEIFEDIKIFKINENNMNKESEDEEVYDSNIEEEFNDVSEVTKRIKKKKRKKSVFYKFFDYEETELKRKDKSVEKSADKKNLSIKKSNLYNNINSIQKKSIYHYMKPSDEDESEINEEEKKKKFFYLSKDLINIIEEINYLFNDSDLSNSLVITWNLYFFLEQLPLIKKKFKNYILEYICNRTKSVGKLTQIFNNYMEFDITVDKLKNNIYTKTILDVLDTSINNIKNTLNNTLYHIFKILSIRIICYEFQEEMFYELYNPYHQNHVKQILSIFPNTIEKFFMQLPKIYFKNVLTVFTELFIKMWILIIVEKGFSNYIYTDSHIKIMREDNQHLRDYIKTNNIQLTHYYLNKKYNINEYIDMFFDKLDSSPDIFSKIINEQRNKKSKNIVSSVYNKGMSIIAGKNNINEEKRKWKDNIFNFSKKKDIG